ncbi:MAG: hypothetical protein SGARI_004497 [Bacillariaceae sp.]
MVDRAAMLFLTMKRDPLKRNPDSPEYIPTKGIKQTIAMGYAGFNRQACQSKTAQYAKVTRRWKKLKQQNAQVALQIETAAAADAGPQLVTPTNDAGVDDENPTRRAYEWSSEDIDDLLEANYFLPPTYPVDTMEDPASLTGKQR